jgi:hypothetical protein
MEQAMCAAYLYAIVCLGVDSTCKRADVCVVDVHILSHRWSQGWVTDSVQVQGSHMGVQTEGPAVLHRTRHKQSIVSRKVSAFTCSVLSVSHLIS